jgi:hypothetical protein
MITGKAKNAFRGHLEFQMAHLASRPGFQGTISLTQEQYHGSFIAQEILSAVSRTNMRLKPGERDSNASAGSLCLKSPFSVSSGNANGIQAVSLGLATIQRGATPGNMKEHSTLKALNQIIQRTKRIQPVPGCGGLMALTWGSRSLGRGNPRLIDFIPLG